MTFCPVGQDVNCCQGIFNHLRKIRNTKYPIQRVLRLLEAISKDVSSQLLKVLGTRCLTYVPYEEFGKVMSEYHEVFTTWDDEYDKLQCSARRRGTSSRRWWGE